MLTSVVHKSSVPFFGVSLMACLSVLRSGFVPPFPPPAFEQPNVIRLNERNNVNTPPHTTDE